MQSAEIKDKKSKPPKYYNWNGRKMIARVYNYLQKEYHYLDQNNHDFCYLRPLVGVKRRIQRALDISTTTTYKYCKEEEPKTERTDSNPDYHEQDIIVSIFRFLREEYNYMKENNHESCDFTILANITKRTAEATGVSESTVTTLVQDNDQIRDMIFSMVNFLTKEHDYLLENSFCCVRDFFPVRKRVSDASNISIHTISKIMRDLMKKQEKPRTGCRFICDEGCEIIFKLHRFLKKEYDSRKEQNHTDCCCLSFLANITKRTANATGVSEYDVTAIIFEEEKKRRHFLDENICLVKMEVEAETDDNKHDLLATLKDDEQFGKTCNSNKDNTTSCETYVNNASDVETCKSKYNVNYNEGKGMKKRNIKGRWRRNGDYHITEVEKETEGIENNTAGTLYKQDELEIPRETEINVINEGYFAVKLDTKVKVETEILEIFEHDIAMTIYKENLKISQETDNNVINEDYYMEQLNTKIEEETKVSKPDEAITLHKEELATIIGSNKSNEDCHVAEENTEVEEETGVSNNGEVVTIYDERRKKETTKIPSRNILVRGMIIKMVDFLQREFDYLHHNTWCNQKSLQPVRKRVAEASNVTLNYVDCTMENRQIWENQKIERQFLCDKGRDIVTRLYNYLKKEYDIIIVKSHKKCFCLNFLGNIRKRTSDATGLSEDDVTEILDRDLKKRISNDSHSQDEKSNVADIVRKDELILCKKRLRKRPKTCRSNIKKNWKSDRRAI